jgi:DNA-directed RNA polymerase specialized sigma24 family protein
VSRGDDLLRSYLCAGDEDAERTLTQLCVEVLLPSCRLIVRARLWRHRDDVEDVIQEVVTRLVARVRAVRASGDHSSIRGVGEWAMGAASRACSDFLRKEHPLRTHLSNALRYRFSKSVPFPVWKGPNGRSVCGWHRCRHLPPLTDRAFLDVIALPQVAERLANIEPGKSETLWRALTSIFACAEGPIYFHALVSELVGRTIGGDGRRAALDDVASTASDDTTDDVLVRKEAMRSLWQAVMRLPRDERLSLLLNLRGPEGLAAWWLYDVVPAAAVAAAVELSLDELEQLPFNDLEIADRLGLPGTNETKRRQQIINLRRSAKRKLGTYFH